MEQKKKYFMITIDTEGDNLWEWKEGTYLGTENTSFLPRFQDLCSQYHFIPTWFCNWEMANDENFTAFANENLSAGREYEVGGRHAPARLEYAAVL